jgi:hypothetical protein
LPGGGIYRALGNRGEEISKNNVANNATIEEEKMDQGEPIDASGDAGNDLSSRYQIEF